MSLETLITEAWHFILFAVMAAASIVGWLFSQIHAVRTGLKHARLETTNRLTRLEGYCLQQDGRDPLILSGVAKKDDVGRGMADWQEKFLTELRGLRSDITRKFDELQKVIIDIDKRVVGLENRR